MHTSRKIFKNTFALSIASAGQLIGNIVLFFYLSRLLQAEGLGVYSTVTAIFNTACLGLGIGLNTLLPRELSKDLTQTNRYLINGCLISLSSAIIIIIALALLVPYLDYLPLTKLGLYIISLALIPESIQVVLFATFISYQKAGYISATSIFVIFGRIISSLIALHLGFGVISLIVIYIVFSYLSLLANIYFLTWHIIRPYWDFNWFFLLNILRQLKVFAGLAILNGLFSQSEVIILSLISGETEVGFYSAALKLVTIWSMIPSSYMTATFPVLSAAFQESRQKATTIQNKSLKYLMAAAFPLAFGITVTASSTIPLIYGDGFQKSIPALGILAWYLPLVFCNMVLWRVLVIHNKQRVVLRIQFFTEIIQALLAVFLIPYLGVNGAAISLLGGNLAYTIFHVFYIQRDNIHLPLFHLGWRFVLASMIMSVFIWVFTQKIHVIILIPAAAVLYFAMLWILQAFSSDDISLFKQMLGFSRETQPQ